MVCRHVNYLIKICLVIKMTLTRNQRKFSWTNRMSAFASCRFQKGKHNLFMNCLISPRRMIKNIDSSKEGSDRDYAALSNQENRQQISPRSNRHVCLT